MATNDATKLDDTAGVEILLQDTSRKSFAAGWTATTSGIVSAAGEFVPWAAITHVQGTRGG